MHWTRTTLRRYPFLAVTVLVGAVGGLLELAGQPRAALWVISAYVIAFAARRCLHMVAQLREGRYGVDILAVTAIAATVAVQEYWASLVIVLMMSTGELLDTIAAGRAERELSALLSRVPLTAHLLTAGGSVGQTTDVPVGDVGPGASCSSNQASSCRWTRCSSRRPRPSTSRPSPVSPCPSSTPRATR